MPSVQYYHTCTQRLITRPHRTPPLFSSLVLTTNIHRLLGGGGARAPLRGDRGRPRLVEAERGGLPDTVASAYGSYSTQIANARLIASLGFTYAEETYMDITQSVMLPSYSVWTASVSYITDGHFEMMGTINNVFDEKYYTSADLFDAVVVKPSEGTTASIMLSYKF